MSQKFIDEVRAIVLNNFSDEKFGVPELASQLSLSKSQILRKVKAATGKSINQYIRELRLEKAAKLLKKTDYTIAEISFQVGFGSPSYFNKTFSNYYGIAPGEYKTKSLNMPALTPKETESRPKNKLTNKKVLYPLAIVFLLIIGFLLANNFTSTKTELSNSIAVLPFKNFSPEDTQWFSDGVSDNILHSLAQMHDLTVISFTSSSTYRETDKQIPEIAKELGVSYILEGSVTLYEGELKIIAQLIDANDHHVWSKEYNETFDDIITVQKNVAQEVMKQLKITLSPQEKVTLEKYPTQNMEAYNLHLKGRLLNDSRKLKDIELNIEYNKQAIALDSSFSEAYAEVAQSYYLLRLSSYYNGYDAIKKSNYYAEKAIKINPNNYRAWGVKALLYHHKDWDKANEYYKKAIAINPNDALLHIQYARYFLYNLNPDKKKYLEHLTIAYKLNPLSITLGTDYLLALTLNNKFKEAEDYLNKMEFIFSDKEKVIHQSRLIAYKNKDWTTILPFLKAKIKEEPENSAYYSMLGNFYDGILNDDSTATKYHKKAYELNSTNSRFLASYSYLLSESKDSENAIQLMESENFKTNISKSGQKWHLWYYYYHQENYKKALEISKDSLLRHSYTAKAWTYAQLGDKKKVDSITKKLFMGVRHDRYWRTWRAFTHAILQERDSMYYYLETAKYDGSIRYYQNSRREFDPYRNEERWKAILRDNYLPVSEE